MITQDQAVKIAQSEFAKHGHVPSEYTVSVDPEDANATYWLIWFDRKGPPVPGGRHAVRVNKTTGRAEFMPGE